MNYLKPKYNLGRVYNKCLIVEILSLAYRRGDVYETLFKASKSLRSLLLDNLKTVNNIAQEVEPRELNFNFTNIFQMIG